MLTLTLLDRKRQTRAKKTRGVNENIRKGLKEDKS